MMLEEKEQAEEEREAEKHVGKFKKALNKLVRAPDAVDKIASKMDAKKMAELKKKMKSGELDEEKLAKVMLQHSLKEGWIK
jgi:anti-sigma28 factor (negative regulator of flagellin synthesis)